MPDARPLMPVPYVWKMGIARKCPCPILSDVALPMPARPPFFLPVPTLARGDFDQIKIYIFSQCVKEEMHRLLSKGGFAL